MSGEQISNNQFSSILKFLQKERYFQGWYRNDISIYFKFLIHNFDLGRINRSVKPIQKTQPKRESESSSRSDLTNFLGE